MYTRKWLCGGPAKKDAQRFLIEKLDALNNGTYRESSVIPFDPFGDK